MTDLLSPAGVDVDPATGVIAQATGNYVKRLSELRGWFQDGAAFEALVAAGDPVAYEVYEYAPSDAAGDLIFGTSILNPGRVGDEFFLTRGHFHAVLDRSEVYYTLAGEGLLLMQSPDGVARAVEMRPGGVAYAPPAWAHRSVNTGAVPLISLFVYPADAGHDYGSIADKGMAKLVVARDGGPTLVDNPAYGG